MGVTPLDALRARLAEADTVVPVGARTQWEIGGAVHAVAPVEVRGPIGVVSYVPADMTVTVGAGTSCRDLEAVLAEELQECPLDPRDPAATVGGVLAAGVSGTRRLRLGPLRDHVLEVRFVIGDGRVIRGGGPTVKNVTGYDLPRLLVGSLGTLGVLTQVTVRTAPIAETSGWHVTELSPTELRARLLRPSCLAWDGRRTHVLLEGNRADVVAQAVDHGLDPTSGGPAWPEGPHRGRISVPSTRLEPLASRLRDLECSWIAEGGVGTVHVAADHETGLAAARAAAEAEQGWLLREAGAPGLDPFGITPANLAIMQRVKDAFDPAGKVNPGRLPLTRAVGRISSAEPGT